MARWIMAALLLAAPLATASSAHAGATLQCKFSGRNVQALITNDKDGPRACKAECEWRYANIPFTGTGGAQLEAGEAKTAYRGTAPRIIERVYSQNLTCDR
jgi:hypothetical protein